jgi:hypothetical protein
MHIWITPRGVDGSGNESDDEFVERIISINEKVK